jgi:hypothetical protein
LAALREWFTLGEGARARAALGADRAAFDGLFERAQKRVSGADALWREGARAEALAMVALACEDLRAIAERFEPLAARLEGVEGLASGERYADRDEALPSDADARFRRALGAASVALARLRGASLTPAGRVEALGLRYVTLALSVLGASVVVREALYTHRLRARASSFFSTNFAPQLAVDRKPNTQWLLPDGQLGWLHVTFPPRRARILRLLNTQALSNYGTAACRVELYAGQRVVQTLSVNMRAMVANPQPLRLPLSPPEAIDGVRIHIEEYVGIGGGLAEVEVE